MTAALTKRLAAVFAHPDDDTYGVSGSVALHASSGIEVTVILATSGEAGGIADPSLATPETLATVREAEDRASWAEIGVVPAIHFLRYPDGGVADAPRAELVARVVDILVAAAPDVVVTFGPDGVTAHADHIAIGEAATEAFHAARARGGGRGFRRLLYNALPQSRLDRWSELMRERGMEPLDPTQPFVPRGVADGTIGVVANCRSVYERKLEALRCHKTQGELESVPFELWPEVLGEEAFVLAWPGGPQDPEAARVLADVFEGLADS